MAPVDPSESPVPRGPYWYDAPIYERHPWLRFVIDHNPFFLLSGASMLLGCFLINHAAHTDIDDHGRLWLLLGLLAVFNVYEALVVPLGLYLLRARSLVRDAGYLLFLEVFLLADTSLIFNEIATLNSRAGVLVGAALLVLAVAKLWFIARYARLRLTPSAWSLIGVNLFALYALPVALRIAARQDIGEPVLPPELFLPLWWAAGLLIAAHALPRRWMAHPTGQTSFGRLRRALSVALVVAPLVSLVGHLRAAHYVYEQEVLWCYFTPIVLGAAVAMLPLLLGRVTNLTLELGALAAAGLGVLLSLTFPSWLLLPVEGMPDLSPMRLSLVGASGLLAFAWWLLGGWLLPVVAVAAVTIAGLGTTIREIDRTLVWMARQAVAVLRQLLPRTAMAWGVVSVAASFVLLLAGAAVSLLKRPRA